jgi:hypothetical protein
MLSIFDIEYLYCMRAFANVFIKKLCATLYAYKIFNEEIKKIKLGAK